MARYNLDGLTHIQPALAVAYLSGTGWTVKEEGPDQVRFQFQDEANPADLSLPRDPSRAEYAERMADVVDCVQQVEKRPLPAILTDLLHADADIVRIHFAAANQALPLGRGVALMQGLQRLLTAAAWGRIAPGPYFVGRKPALVGQYVQAARIGQTEAPGFVTSVIVPLGEASEDSFGRRVTHSLATLLNELQAINYTPGIFADVEIRRRLIDDGLSANLCEALAKLFGKPTGRRKAASRIDLRFRWSPLVSVPAETPSAISFESDAVPMLKDLSELLRETTPKEGFQLKGVVTDLRRRDEGGRIVVNNVGGEEPEKVTIELEDELYNVAIQAHRDKTEVTCTGTLVKRRSSYELQDAAIGADAS